MLFLQTQAYRTHGGMQTYMRRLAEIMTAVCGELHEPFVSVSVTDLKPYINLHPNSVHYDEFIGAGGDKARFIGATLRTLLHQPQRVAVLGHIALAPIAYLCKRLGLINHYILVLHGVEAWKQHPKHVRVACRHSTAIIATTRYTACEFQVQNLFAHPKMYIVPLALAESSLARLESRTKNPKLEVLAVGRLDSTERYKGFECVMGAVGKLAKAGVSIRLRIAGTGDDFPRLQARATSIAPADAIEMLGNVDESKMPELYGSCDVFAMPSRKEGFGLVFLEAMRFGKACVGGRHGGTPEVIRDGTDGFLVNYGDEDALVRIFKELSNNRVQAERMGRSAFERVASEYVFPVMKNRWRAILHGVHQN